MKPNSIKNTFSLTTLSLVLAACGGGGGGSVDGSGAPSGAVTGASDPTIAAVVTASIVEPTLAVVTLKTTPVDLQSAEGAKVAAALMLLPMLNNYVPTIFEVFSASTSTLEKSCTSGGTEKSTWNVADGLGSYVTGNLRTNVKTDCAEASNYGNGNTVSNGSVKFSVSMDDFPSRAYNAAYVTDMNEKTEFTSGLNYKENRKVDITTNLRYSATELRLIPSPPFAPTGTRDITIPEQNILESDSTTSQVSNLNGVVLSRTQTSKQRCTRFGRQTSCSTFDSSLAMTAASIGPLNATAISTAFGVSYNYLPNSGKVTITQGTDAIEMVFSLSSDFVETATIKLANGTSQVFTVQELVTFGRAIY